jgi:hypothetical protein
MRGRFTITTLWTAPLLALAVALGVAAVAPAASAQSQSRLDRLISQCRAYADNAVQLNRINHRRNCGYRGTRWSYNRLAHFRWCISAPPAARQREVRARVDQLRACSRPGGCTREYRPVCAIRDRRRRTYSNACLARRAGARIVGRGRCRGPGPGPGPGRACRLDNARLTVSSQNCSPKTLRLRFGRRFLRDGEMITRSFNSGAIGRGARRWGVCNFHTRLRYICRNGRLRIRRVFQCQQAHTNRTSANCRVSN